MSRQQVSKFAIFIDDCRTKSTQEVKHLFEKLGGIRAADSKPESADADMAYQSLHQKKLHHHHLRLDMATREDFQMFGWEWTDGQTGGGEEGEIVLPPPPVMCNPITASPDADRYKSSLSPCSTGPRMTTTALDRVEAPQRKYRHHRSPRPRVRSPPPAPRHRHRRHSPSSLDKSHSRHHSTHHHDHQSPSPRSRHYSHHLPPSPRDHHHNSHHGAASHRRHRSPSPDGGRLGHDAYCNNPSSPRAKNKIFTYQGGRGEANNHMSHYPQDPYEHDGNRRRSPSSHGKRRRSPSPHSAGRSRSPPHHKPRCCLLPSRGRHPDSAPPVAAHCREPSPSKSVSTWGYTS